MKAVHFPPPPAPIESVLIFRRSDPPAAVAAAQSVPVADADERFPSASAALAHAAAVAVEASNCPSSPSIGSRPVVLEAVRISLADHADPALTGSVLVRNIAFCKSVSIRISADAWKTHADVAAVFDAVAAPSAGTFLGVDRFVFSVPLSAFAPKQADPLAAPPPLSIEFAVLFVTSNGPSDAPATHWDNNDGANYALTIRCPSPAIAAAAAAASATTRSSLPLRKRRSRRSSIHPAPHYQAPLTTTSVAPSRPGSNQFSGILLSILDNPTVEKEQKTTQKEQNSFRNTPITSQFISSSPSFAPSTQTNRSTIYNYPNFQTNFQPQTNPIVPVAINAQPIRSVSPSTSAFFATSPTTSAFSSPYPSISLSCSPRAHSPSFLAPIVPPISVSPGNYSYLDY